MMRKKVWASFIVLLLLPVFVRAQPFSPTSVYIKAGVLPNGFIEVKEYYSFPKSLEENLLSLSEELGPRYSLWRTYIQNFEFHICQNPKTIRITLQSEEVPKVVLFYICPPPKPVEEDLFFVTYKLSSIKLPVVSGLVVLPENFTLEVVLDRGEVLFATPQPSIRDRTRVVWEGPLSSAENFSLTYRIPKVYRAPSVSLTLYQELSNPRSLFFILATLIIIYSVREKLKERVVHWVSSNTEIRKE